MLPEAKAVHAQLMFFCLNISKELKSVSITELVNYITCHVSIIILQSDSKIIEKRQQKTWKTLLNTLWNYVINMKLV